MNWTRTSTTTWLDDHCIFLGLKHCLLTLRWAALLVHLQLTFAIPPSWNTTIFSASSFISTVALFIFFNNLVSADRCIWLYKAICILPPLEIHILLYAVFATLGKSIIVGFHARCCFVKHNIISIRISRCTFRGIGVML